MAEATAEAKMLAAMTTEVLEWCQSKGWYDKPVSFGEAMALLHSEVSEAIEAWRKWGLADSTDPVDEPNCTPKPEGVGSEFADILIRLLDDCGRFGVDLEDEVRRHAGRYGLHDSFLENMNALHGLIALASMGYELDGPDAVLAGAGADWRVQFAAIYVFLRQCCETYGIDLQAEYERKMTYNRTRPYRHGKRQ
jgi:NTP pyrophosphatase (non-canonical NTP hydrolase)